MVIIGELFLMVFGLVLLAFSRQLANAANRYWSRFQGREMHYTKAYRISFFAVGLFFLVFSILGFAGLVHFGE